MRIGTAALTLALAFSLPAVPAAQAFPGASSAHHAHAHVQSSVESALLRETNLYRAARGLPALQPHADLDRIAQHWSEGMAASKSMRHNPGYTDTYPGHWTKAAENVGWANYQMSAAEMVRAWANSPTHRKNLESSDFTHIGVGWATTPDGSVYATQNFARF